MLDMLYCSGGNEPLMKIAYDAGFLLGIRSDRRSYGLPISFVDIEYRHPDFDAHLAVVARLKPRYATVPDLSEIEVCEQDIERAVNQAELLRSYCDHPLIVPKLSGQLAFIPPEYAIAYSVPTSYGGAKYGVWKLSGRRIHLLGGSPHMQMKLYRYLSGEVMSADGNMAQLMATRFARYWQGGKWVSHPERHTGTKDLYLDCWRRSCVNIREAWIARAQ